MDLKQLTSKEVEMNLEVIPNSKKFSIQGINPWKNTLRIKVKERALKGKANKELSYELEKILNAEVRIIKGTKTKKLL